MANSLIKETESYVKKLMNQEPGHDWFHVERVRKLAKRIGEEESADLFVVDMAAMLHDIDDWKFNDEKEGPKKALAWLNKIKIDEKTKNHIVDIINNVSFKGGTARTMSTIEGKVVQDADRIDAIGAIGISRCFSFAGFVGNPIHDPAVKPRMNMTKEEYKKNRSTAINHFYEKVLLLKDKMNTEMGRRMAEERHRFVEKYLEQFFKEWEGKV